MKRGTPNHPKTLALAAALGLERYAAVGILECLWHFAGQYARRGDIGRHANTAIAAGVGWSGDAEEFISALVTCGWLDACPCHRLRIHDWHEHADQPVHKTTEVRNQGFIECYETDGGRISDGYPKDSGDSPPAGIRHKAQGTGQTAKRTNSLSESGEKRENAIVGAAGDEEAPRDSDDESRRAGGGGLAGRSRVRGSEERLAGLRSHSRGRNRVRGGEARLESARDVGATGADSDGPASVRDRGDDRPPEGSAADERAAEDQVRGSNFRAAADLDIKILRACREISRRTGLPGWKVMRQITSYKRPDGSMSAGVEDPSRLGSVLAREKALGDATWWLEHPEGDERGSS